MKPVTAAPKSASAAPTNSLIGGIFVLCGTCLGAGILSLSFAVCSSGWLLGIFLLAFFGVITAFSMRLLIAASVFSRCYMPLKDDSYQSKHQLQNSNTYQAIGEAVFPKYGFQLVTVCTLTLIFGSLTAFLVIIADNLYGAIALIAKSTLYHDQLSGIVPAPVILNHPDWYRPLLLIAAVSFIVFPLSLLRSVHSLERWARAAVAIVIIFAGCTTFQACYMLNNNQYTFSIPNFQAYVISYRLLDTAIPILALAYTCQMMLFPVWSSLSNPSPSQIRTVTDSTILICSVPYILVGVGGYYTFGDRTAGDLTTNGSIFEAPLVVGIIQLLFAISICIHFPITHFAFRSTLASALYDREELPEFPYFVVTSATCILTTVLAIAIPQLESVFSLTGTLCSYPFCFILPSLFYIRSRSSLNQTMKHSPEIRPTKTHWKSPAREFLPYASVPMDEESLEEEEYMLNEETLFSRHLNHASRGDIELGDLVTTTTYTNRYHSEQNDFRQDDDAEQDLFDMNSQWPYSELESSSTVICAYFLLILTSILWVLSLVLKVGSVLGYSHSSTTCGA